MSSRAGRRFVEPEERTKTPTMARIAAGVRHAPGRNIGPPSCAADGVWRGGVDGGGGGRAVAGVPASAASSLARAVVIPGGDGGGDGGRSLRSGKLNISSFAGSSPPSAAILMTIFVPIRETTRNNKITSQKIHPSQPRSHVEILSA